MPWEVRGGRTVKVSNDVEVEVEATVDTGAVDTGGTYACPRCGKEYKTIAGAENHLAKKHSEE